MPEDQRGDQEFLENLLQYHPEYLSVLEEEEQALLLQYYFTPAGVDGEAYRDGLKAADPNAEMNAQKALSKLFELNDVHLDLDNP
jgi:hypothetical protein